MVQIAGTTENRKEVIKKEREKNLKICYRMNVCTVGCKGNFEYEVSVFKFNFG